MTINPDDFLPTSLAVCRRRGWQEVDVVLVSGDAYVDHPAFGIAVIGRLLEAQGLRVAILAQPDYRRGCKDFQRFGRPRLFFGISAGNLDSLVANYTGGGKVRNDDPYSPEGNPYFAGRAGRGERRRPDRATILYANLARQAYKDVAIVLGGLEASLRRFIHYDFRQEKLRGSILSDAKADLLVYGMGERAVLEIARRLQAGQDLADIPGTCEVLPPRPGIELAGAGAVIRLPGWGEIQADRGQFLRAELLIDEKARAGTAEVLLQEQKSGWLKQNPSAAPLDSAELDKLYRLPFTRLPHPDNPRLPAYEMIRDSITIVRGCSGNCSFCALTRHQGARVTSRGRSAIVEEVKMMAAAPGFSGIISDLGGPTANLYATFCKSQRDCDRHDCLYPQPCANLVLDEKAWIKLLDEVERLPKVRRVFISSGLRLALLRRTPKLLRRLLERHLPGAMKIAPEHTEPEILRLMHKNDGLELAAFLRQSRGLAQKAGLKVHFNPYLIASHPGCRLQEMEKMAGKLKSLGLKARQFQDFTPTPGTIATAMYYSGFDRDTFKPLHIAKGAAERRRQRAALEKISGRKK